jgi:cation diffusion facilitator CzcD-associated flavoprotein CzcO
MNFRVGVTAPVSEVDVEMTNAFMDKHDVAVIGAGPAGVATAVSLRDRGLGAVVIDRAGEVASSWRGRYERLKLNSGKQFSHLPRRPYPKGTPTFPTRHQVADYLDGQARAAGTQLWLNTAVERIDARPDGWRLVTSRGDIDARNVVVATGYEHTPHMPEWPGAHGFTGQLLHSSAYRSPVRYAGQRVLVVGAGSSGMEIAHDLAGGWAAKVWLAVRTPPNILLRTGPGGLPADLLAIPLYHLPIRLADAIARLVRLQTIGDLTEFGLPIPDEGPFARTAANSAPAVIDMDVIDAVKDRSIEVVKTVGSFDRSDVLLTDGTRLQPHAVICATGYLRGLEPLVGHLGVLDEQGAPRVLAPACAADGLWFIGFLSRPALIGHMAKQARRLAKRIADDL